MDDLLQLLRKLAEDAGPPGVPAIAAIDDLSKQLSDLQEIADVIDTRTLVEIERYVLGRRACDIELYQRGSTRNKVAIAKSLGIERNTLDRKLKKYELQ